MIFISSPGDSDMNQSLRTTGLKLDQGSFVSLQLQEIPADGHPMQQ